MKKFFFQRYRTINIEKKKPVDFCCKMMENSVLEEGDILFSKKYNYFYLLALDGKKVKSVPLCYCPWCGFYIGKTAGIPENKHAKKEYPG